MRKFRLRLAVAAMFALSAPLATAEDMSYLLKSSPTERAAVQTQFMKQRLQLTDGETAKIQAINQKYAEKMEAAIKGSGSGFSRMREAKGIQEAKDDELGRVLTPEKFEAYSNAKDDLKQAMRQQLKP